MRVRYSRRAAAQLEEILAHISADDAPVAAAVAWRIETLTSLISRHPAIGRQTNLSEIRVMPLKPYPYLVFYRPLPNNTGIVVLRIRHMARAEAWQTGR